jgi:hypothetical protein
MRVNHTVTSMSSSSIDARNKKINSRGYTHKHPTSRVLPKYESNHDGDVVVVEPSFDAEDNGGRSPIVDEKSANGVDARYSPSTKDTSLSHERGHTRNLSEHFYDATILSNEPITEGPPNSSRGYGYRGPPPSTVPAVGQKHRRVFSGDLSNPAEARRRINSIGNLASVKRRPYLQERQHQRVDSAGLDILTAAADVSREELAAVAGEQVRGTRSPWEAPSGSSSRRSPVEMMAYDHSSSGPPPPRGHQRAYPPGPPGPPGPPPPGYYGHGAPLSYPQPPYPPPSFYSHSSAGYQRTMPPAPSGGYPVQFARGPDPYSKHSGQPPLQQPTLDRPSPDSSGRPASPTTAYREHKRPPQMKGGENAMTPPPPVPPSHWRGGSTQGVQTYVTSIGVGEGGRTVRPTAQHRHTGTNTDANAALPSNAHHRKNSSVSSWLPTNVFMGPPGDTSSEHPLKGGHHRSTSSSISFLGFDVGTLDNTDATFLQNLQASTGTAARAFNNTKGSVNAKRTPPRPRVPSEDELVDGKSKLAPGGTSKRVRRKCTIANCGNRVVQGGLCISHGAKRKLCRHAGCDKNVKKAGLCSTHGPARKRCDEGACNKVAVQGGKCIAHGAKKKLCAMEGCTKQSILTGMCKKHHDQSRKDTNQVPSPPAEESFSQSKVVESQPKAGSSKPSKRVHKPTHTRGLSIFQEMSADTVGTLLQGEGEPPKDARPPPGHRHRSSFSRDFGSLY